MIKGFNYYVYDYDISNEWLFRINSKTFTTIWNTSININSRLKEFYEKKYKLNIIKSFK